MLANFVNIWIHVTQALGQDVKMVAIVKLITQLQCQVFVADVRLVSLPHYVKSQNVTLAIRHHVKMLDHVIWNHFKITYVHVLKDILVSYKLQSSPPTTTTTNHHHHTYIHHKHLFFTNFTFFVFVWNTNNKFYFSILRLFLYSHTFWMLNGNLFSHFSFSLSLPFAGKYCEKQNLCASSPCNNGGTCISLPGGDFKCHCPKGFQGKTCSDDVEECNTMPCQHGGTCHNTLGSYQ